MSSDRPRTPPRSVWEERSQSQSQEAGQQQRERDTSNSRQRFEPQLLDFIYPLRDIDSSNYRIPPVFTQAEAVDSALRIGEGASFTASLQKLPNVPTELEIVNHGDGSRIQNVPGVPPTPRFVVYKVARLAFDKEGDPVPEHRKAMLSVLAELHALMFAPLKKHPNIIDFLGVAYGSNPFNAAQRLPALVTEYAEHGTLSVLLTKIQPVDFNTKHLLILDVARGLQALHDVGVVHGDVKAENVLICAHAKRKYVAKLADFGFSVINIGEASTSFIGGTYAWKAPEGSDEIAMDKLHLTDVYSFGLLTWTVAVGGQSPFDLVLDRTATSKEIDFLKQTGVILFLGQQRHWHDLLAKSTAKAMLPAHYRPLFDLVVNNQDFPRSTILGEQLSSLQAKVKEFGSQFEDSKLMKSLKDVFECTVRVSPEHRDLKTALAILLSSDTSQDPIQHLAEEASSAILRTGSGLGGGMSELWKNQGYLKHTLSWQRVRDLDPIIQRILCGFSVHVFLKVALIMNGYGCRPDPVHAFEQLKTAADRGHHISRAYLHRFWVALNATPGVKSPYSESPGVEYLQNYARIGSRPAFEEFSMTASQEEVGKLHRVITDAYGGVGATWLDRTEMLNGFSQSQWIKDDWLLARLQYSQVPPSDIIVNKRGDTVLHFVAMCGRIKPFKILMQEYKMNINIQNPLGETPLLSALRAGQGGIVIQCLQMYKADASIAAHNGETPLHWLVSHENQYVPFIVRDLLANGAQINAVTNQNVCHSEFPGQVDVDFKSPGPALLWAVHENRPEIVRVLLQNGADPYLGGTGPYFQPIVRAAYFHHHECLKVMIEHLEAKVTQKDSNGDIDKRHATKWGPLVWQCVHAADKFSMILRGGEKYLDRLHQTLDLFREKTRMVNFQATFARNMLYSVVSGAHDDVVEYMLQHKWCIEGMNWRNGHAARTPVLEAVRWNRIYLAKRLLMNGGDPKILAANPFRPYVLQNWSALHIFAHEGHDEDLELARILLENIPVDGLESAPLTFEEEKVKKANVESSMSMLSVQEQSWMGHIGLPCETPLAVALRRNAFQLCSLFIRNGANPNALFLSSGLYISNFPTSILGHIIISNARYSSARLKYFLNDPDIIADFVVEPVRRLTALHRSAMAFTDVHRVTGGTVSRDEFDFDTNADIMYELLLNWKDEGCLNARCGIKDRTALHLAVLAGNLGAIESLLKAGANRTVLDGDGKTPLDLAQGYLPEAPHSAKIRSLLS